MKLKINTILYTFLFCFGTIYTTQIYAQDVPKYSNDFMYIGVGANNLALGGAVAATTNDFTAGYWNPAGLVNIQNNIQVGFMHNEYFAGLSKYDHLGVAFPLDSNKHAFAINFIRFAVDDIPNTLFLIDGDGTINYDNVKSFSVGDYGINASYARNIFKNFNVGATAKIVHHKAGGFAKSWGFGVDIGAQYKYKDWQFGLMIKDITTTFNAWAFSFTDREKEVFALTENEIPKNSLEITLPRITLGTAYVKSFKKIDLTAALDWEITTDGKRNTLIRTNVISIDPRLGVEVGFTKIAYVRAGISNFQKVNNATNTKKVLTVQPNIGIGLRFKSIYIDYAFTDVGKTSVNQYSHVVSAKVGINKRKSKTNNLVPLEENKTIITPTENTGF